MKKTALIITILFATITLAGTAMAKGFYSGGGCWNQDRGQARQGYGPMMNNLTPEQQKQLTDLRQTHQDQTAEQQIALIAKEKEIQVLFGTSAPDKARLVQLAQEISDIRAQMAEKRIDFILEARKIAPEVQFGGQYRGNNCQGGGFNKGFNRGGGNQGYPGGGQGCVFN